MVSGLHGHDALAGAQPDVWQEVTAQNRLPVRFLTLPFYR